MRTATEEALLLTADQVEIEASAAAANPCVQFVTDTGGLMTVTGWGPVAIELTGIDASADQVGILGADPKTSVAIGSRRNGARTSTNRRSRA